jgi:hypothetical protein
VRSSKLLEESAAPVTKGTAELTIDAAIASEAAAEISFFICNNSFL